MAKINMMAKLVAFVLLVVPIAFALPVGQDGKVQTTEDPAIPESTTEQVAPAEAKAVDEMLGDEAVSDDDMQDRMAYLILSLWGSELQGLDGLADGRDRTKRDVVFRPLWVSHERHAKRTRLRQRYWDNYRRSQRIGRDVAASASRRQRVPRAAPLDEAALVEAADALRPLSRVRRMWAFRPLFSARQRLAREQRYRRVRRQAAVEEVDKDEDFPRPEAAARKRLARRGAANEPLSWALSRVRREWADVPLFAVRQIEAARVREEEQIDHRRHHAAAPHFQQDYRDNREYLPYGEYRPYRDYYRYNG